jgi:phage tail-like protein
VSVFTLRGWALRGTLAPPAAEVARPWAPIAVAADRRGRVFVADPANGSVHRFAPHGAWETAYRGLGAVRHLAVDRAGRLYVVSDGAAEARVLDRDGIEVERVSDVAALRERFPTLPFRVDREGAIDFGGEGAVPCGAFDAHGEPLPQGAVPDPVVLERDGTYLSEGLDSRIARCQWHRLALSGRVPPGTSVTISTHASEVDEPDDLVAALPDDAWDTWQRARGAEGENAWDCLVRSAPGRFLRVRLRLRGDGRAAPRLERVRVEFPRISLARWLPAVFGADPAASDFTDRFLAIFDSTLRSIERQLDAQGALFDPRSAPATPGADGRPDFLTWIASWVGIALDRHWPEARRREFVRRAPALFDRRGTVEGLRQLLLLFLGLPDGETGSERVRMRPERRHPPRCTPRPLNCDPPSGREPYVPPPLVLEHWRLRRWLFVGAGRIGDQAVLWGNGIVERSRLDDGARTGVTRLVSTPDPYRDPLHVHASRVTVFVPARVARDERGRKGLENLMRSETPAHVRWHLELVEPRFRIGVQSMIGYDAVVGRYPAPRVAVGETTLDRATVLGPAAGPTRPSMRVGGPARVGTTTRLD